MYFYVVQIMMQITVQIIVLLLEVERQMQIIVIFQPIILIICYNLS